jgi:hypothetical protein
MDNAGKSMSFSAASVRSVVKPEKEGAVAAFRI